jgi:hypothetical protein
MVNVTNVTIQYMVSPYSQWNWSYTNVSFGTSNGNYPYRIATNQQTTKNAYTNAFADYLQPGTTYYFSLVGWYRCVYNGVTYPQYNGYYYGQWTTGQDTSTYWYGQVRGAGGGTAPAGDRVELECLSSSYAELGYTGTTTYGAGMFGFYAPGWPYGKGVCAKYEIQYQNGPIPQTPWQNAPTWLGQWNESVIVYGPGWYNLYSTVNFLGPEIPLVLDFTNDNYVSFDYQSTFYSSTESCWQLNGQQQCATGTTTNQVNLQSSAGNNLEYYGEFFTTGLVEFDATNGRAAAPQSWSYVGIPHNTEQFTNLVSDW